MNKGLKIFLGIVVALGVLSGIFLLFAKKKPVVPVKPKTVQTKNQTTSQVPTARAPVQQQNARIAPKAVAPAAVPARPAMPANSGL